jgi:hypothetical protein
MNRILRIIILDAFSPFPDETEKKNPVNHVDPVQKDNAQWPLLGAFLIPPVRLVVLIKFSKAVTVHIMYIDN